MYLGVKETTTKREDKNIMVDSMDMVDLMDFIGFIVNQEPDQEDAQDDTGEEENEDF